MATMTAGWCQPNFRRNVVPNPRLFCGPFQTADRVFLSQAAGKPATPVSRETIGVVAIDKGTVAVGTTTNCASHRVPGRVGDTPIVGAGAYVNGTVGGA